MAAWQGMLGPPGTSSLGAQPMLRARGFLTRSTATWKQVQLCCVFFDTVVAVGCSPACDAQGMERGAAPAAVAAEPSHSLRAHIPALQSSERLSAEVLQLTVRKRLHSSAAVTSCQQCSLQADFVQQLDVSGRAPLQRGIEQYPSLGAAERMHFHLAVQQRLADSDRSVLLAAELCTSDMSQSEPINAAQGTEQPARLFSYSAGHAAGAGASRLAAGARIPSAVQTGRLALAAASAAATAAAATAAEARPAAACPAEARPAAAAATAHPATAALGPGAGPSTAYSAGPSRHSAEQFPGAL